MARLALAIVAIVAPTTAAAEPASDTVMLDGHAYLSFFGPMAGGSIHLEHRFADSPIGLTLRASGSSGATREGRDFGWFAGLAGFRRHWGDAYLEVEAGWAGLRDGRTTDDFSDAIHYGVEWHNLPDLQITFGGRIGPVDVGVFTQVPAAGIGLHLGIAIDG